MTGSAANAAAAVAAGAVANSVRVARAVAKAVAKAVAERAAGKRTSNSRNSKSVTASNRAAKAAVSRAKVVAASRGVTTPVGRSRASRARRGRRLKPRASPSMARRVPMLRSPKSRVRPVKPLVVAAVAVDVAENVAENVARSVEIVRHAASAHRASRSATRRRRCPRLRHTISPGRTWPSANRAKSRVESPGMRRARKPGMRSARSTPNLASNTFRPCLPRHRPRSMR